MRTDTETLAISAIVLALLLYYATRKVKTAEEIKRDDDHKRLAILLTDLAGMEDHYNDLPIHNRKDDKPLEGWIEIELTRMATSLNGMTARLRTFPKGFVHDSVPTRIDHLLHSVREHLNAADRLASDREAHQSLTVTQNKVKITLNTVVNNEFDQRAQTQIVKNEFDLRRQAYVGETTNVLNQNLYQQSIDARTNNFQQTNTEQRILNLNNPYTVPTTVSLETAMGNDVAGVYGHLAPSRPGRNRPLALSAPAITTPMLMLPPARVGSPTLSQMTELTRESVDILRSDIMRSESAGGVDVGGVYAPRSASTGFVTIDQSTNASVADRRQESQDNGGADVTERVKLNARLMAHSAPPRGYLPRGFDVHGQPPLQKKARIDDFSASPTVLTNNFDRTPGTSVNANRTVSPAQSNDMLTVMSEDENPFAAAPTPPASVLRAQQLLSRQRAGPDFRSAKIQSDIKELATAGKYNPEKVLVLETLIRNLEEDTLSRGTRAERESFQSSKAAWVKVLTKHKQTYGQRLRKPPAKGPGGERPFRDINTRQRSITQREDKGLTLRKKEREELMNKRRDGSNA